MQKGLKSNIWKYFLFVLTSRRNYMPILALYFLTLPDTTAQQLGLFTGIGWFVGFLLEIPSGYLSDKIGHKQSLILAKISLLISTLFFVFGNSLPYFILGSSFIAMGFAFTSGTGEAFLHNTLLKIKKEGNYAETDGKIKANVSLISVVMILLLPILTKISLVMPIGVYLVFDIVGLMVALSFVSPKIEYTAEDIEGESILSQLKRFKGKGFYLVSIFLGIGVGLMYGLSPFKEPFAESLGFPIVFIGAIMALSRLVWFFVGHNLKLLKRIKFKNLVFYEALFFSGAVILSSQMTNPYVGGFVFALALGYCYGRDSLIQEYYLQHFLVNKRYKATMLSIKKQFVNLFEAGITFGAGFLMVKSFSFGFLISGLIALGVLATFYPFVRRSLK